jgi:CRP-like cAMP-binding protein
MSEQRYPNPNGQSDRTFFRRPAPGTISSVDRFITAQHSSIPFTGLLTNQILTSLPGGDLARLLPHLEPISLIAGRCVYEFGNVSDFVYFPETAVISHVHILEDGGTTAAAIVGREGLIGLSALVGTTSSYWAQVTVGGSALRVKSEVLRDEFRSNHAMQFLVLKHLGARLAQLSQRAVCNSRHLLEERFCTWLLMILDRTRREEVPITHELIAQHMGARRAGITGACNALRDAGIIQYRRRLMTITDRTKLESVACECYRAVRDLTSDTPPRSAVLA